MDDDARITVDGIGGFFFSSRDPERLTEWYDRHLGVLPPPSSYGGRVWRQEAGPTVVAVFAGQPDPDHIGPSGWGINFRVADLDGLVGQLRSDGVEVVVNPEAYPNGRFASLRDPDGNPVELWQPAD
jgi:catechol 2,3-dioxygenase-like lactoylglutathione lyase family enzyme